MNPPYTHLRQTSVFKVPGMNIIDNMSVLSPDMLWVSSYNTFKQVNIRGNVIRTLNSGNEYDIVDHVVSKEGCLIYCVHRIRRGKMQYEYGIHMMRSDGSKATLLKLYIQTTCIYSSHINGDLLVGLYNKGSNRGLVRRYDRTGIEDIKFDGERQGLYEYPAEISENKINGDIVVLDFWKYALVVVDRSGRHRFDYRGQPTDLTFKPRGVCTDVQGHILVAHEDVSLSINISLLDKDGRFLTRLLKEKDMSDSFRSLSVDDKNTIYVNMRDTIEVYRLD